MNSKEERMRELVHRLNETAYAYYVLDDPVISDMQWDQLYDELKNLHQRVIPIGDAVRSGTIADAVHSGYDAVIHLI